METEKMAVAGKCVQRALSDFTSPEEMDSQQRLKILKAAKLDKAGWASYSHPHQMNIKKANVNLSLWYRLYFAVCINYISL